MGIGGGHAKNTAFEGGHPKKIREKGGGGGAVKYFSNTLKWHNVLILKKLLLNKRSGEATNLLQTSIPL